MTKKMQTLKLDLKIIDALKLLSVAENVSFNALCESALYDRAIGHGHEKRLAIILDRLEKVVKK